MSKSPLAPNKSRWNKFWFKLPIVYRGAIILGIPAIAILPALASWSWSRQAKAGAMEWINHTQEVIRETNTLMRVLVDAETGVQGYVITRDRDFLDLYNDAIKNIPLYITQIEQLTQDNIQQRRQLKIIERQIDNKLNLLQRVINNIEKAENTYQNTELKSLFISGKAEMDRVRNSVDLFKDEEWSLLDSRQQRLNQIKRTTNILSVVTIGLGLLGYSLAIKLYYAAEFELEEKLKELDRNNTNLSQANQLIEERNRELDQFTYIVSHDLKAPLRAISNLSAWIEEDLEDKLDEETAQNMTLLRSRVRRMDNFIDGLLEYARAGKAQEEVVTVDTQQLLYEIIDSIAPPPEFTIEIKDKMPILQTEALALQQVFSNLISNAIKHHHRNDGKVTISATKDRDFYQFSVADDGAGIAKEHQEKIFMVFQTLTDKDTKENTGIGLSIVKKIIDRHEGKIWLESQLGSGTTFYFTWKNTQPTANNT